jgi:predicted Zn-dependent protease with MMP-like domain
MDRKEFERVAQEAFDALPEKFRETIENVHIVVEDLPGPATAGRRSGTLLLGLYEGIPLSRRGTSYGMYPSVPDKITLYQKNIETVAATDQELRACIRDVLIHEIGHYFGMSESEIRRAGY